ncbi:MAG: hypothetical protein LBV13_02780 [Methanomassiliicoccaceae archaeon]|jgi:hypothetical protein|nr:hypothetical protein [Methanomassiliicoccaceae archaeon]
MTLKEDIISDLSPKNGSLSGALISFFIAIGVFVIFPYIIFILTAGYIDDNIAVLEDIGPIKGAVWAWVEDIIKYSFPLVILSLFIGFYRAGSYVRIPLKILFALYIGAWLWISSHGGVFGFSAGGMTLGLDITHVVYVMVMISFAMIFVAFAEFSGNRKKYLEAIDKKKDTMSRRRARRLSG